METLFSGIDEEEQKKHMSHLLFLASGLPA